jgi:opacity protein-like surface antigen
MATAGILVIISLSPVWVESGEPELEPGPTAKIIWTDGIGSGFSKDVFQAGGTVGAGFGSKVFGSTQNHDLALASVNFGWVFTDIIASDKWYRGNLELLVELFGGWQFNPDDRYFVGLTPLIRYNFATRSRWMPFVDAGAGVSATNIEGPDLTGTFQFNIQVGAGTHYLLSDRTALTLQYRWLHFSNACIERPNHGTNTQMFHVGMSWFF